MQGTASYLAAQQQQNASVLASITDLYSRLPATSGGDAGVWEWTTSMPVEPGGVHIEVLGETNRKIQLSLTDVDDTLHDLSGLDVGDTIVLTDDPDTPPVTAFRQYVVGGRPVYPPTAQWITINAVRVAIFGSQDTPTPGTRLRLILG